MKILLLAPHPFYRERGTPIAVNLLLRALSGQGHQVDVLTYHIGAEVDYPGVKLHRIASVPGIKDVPPGWSIRKLICDVWMLAKALRMAARGGYRVTHAVEESVFIALVLKKLFGIPYVCDMDSSMPAQLVEKYPFLRCIAPLMRFAEGVAIRHAAAVAAVCDALADIAKNHRARRVFLLRDISLLESDAATESDDARDAVRREFGLTGYCFMYIGNLEEYQGIDLLLAGFADLEAPERDRSTLAIVGGTARDIDRYRSRADTMGLADRVIFTGPQPVQRMAELFCAADALASPRIKGGNTPMKIYSYMASGRPILATDLPTHTQALPREAAVLVAPIPSAMADGMRLLMNNPEDSRALAERARLIALAKYSMPAFKRTVEELYQWLDGKPSRCKRVGVNPL